MLQSPFLADHRIEAEYWYEALAGIEEIIDLWVVCQAKWLYLLKVRRLPGQVALLAQGTSPARPSDQAKCPQGTSSIAA